MQRWDIAWDAARAASKRPLRKPYKPVAPVGAKLSYFEQEASLKRPWLSVGDSAGTVDAIGCLGCGYHVCSCERPCPNCGHKHGDSVCSDCRCEVGPDGYRVSITHQTVVGPLTVRIARPGEVPGTFYFPPEGP